MDEEYVFRFLSVRPANLKKKLERQPSKVDLYPEQIGDSPLHQAIVAASGSETEVIRLATQFKASTGYVRELKDLSIPIQPGIDWVQMNTSLALSDPNVKTKLEELFGLSLPKLIAKAEFKDSFLRIADTLLAETILHTHEIRPDQLVIGHKFLTLLLDLGAASRRRVGSPTLDEVVGARTVFLSTTPPRQTVPSAPSETPPAPSKPTDSDEEKRRQLLAAYEVAHKELSNIAGRPEALTTRAATTGTNEQIEVLKRRLQACEAKAAQTSTSQSQTASAIDLSEARRPVISAAALENFSAATLKALENLKLDFKNLEPVATVRILEQEMNSLGAELASTQKSPEYIVLGGAQLERSKLEASFSYFGVSVPPKLDRSKCNFQAGVGDLLIVKQKLKAYELAEFAHVENVLAGETRDREHRRLDQREDITITEEETETVKEKDLQSTHRNEMQTEATKTVKQQFGLEAGLQISGSYGPTVSFAAHLNANFSTTSEETQRKAVSFSQEVTEKTSESVRQRVKQTVTHRVLQEIQEINKHAFVNSSVDKHIRGIYRWLNKVYDAQIFNYGQRMMYEFVVPEPAAYFIYAMIENPPQDSELVKPDPPTFAGSPLKPSHLSRTNYQDYVAKYKVHAAPPPPPQFQNVAYFDKQDKVQDGSIFGRASKIDIPTGYEAYAASVMSDYTYTSGAEHLYHVLLGNRAFDQSDHWGHDYQHLDTRYRELAVAYKLFNAWAFTLGIDVDCQLTTVAFTKWQQDAYDAIIEAYLRLKADYDEKIAVKAIQQDPAKLGRNPLENQRLTKEELKKLVLMIFTGSDSIARDSFLASSEPYMDLAKVCENGSWIRFFENAFEWTNMTYVLYSYFWGRHARWNSAIHFTDPDSDFAAFLRAGAARVQVPVRPGFEKALVHFLQFNEIWQGNDPPMINDDLYVPIVDEIAANLGKFDNDGVPYPEGSHPWEVRVPTDLVLVQNLEEIPNIRDILTGNNVKIHD